ncbi:MAG: polysaccharide pyruvyl transferase family protein [Chitinispirillaceae bacterium]|nr:polysaccharide pyruvyl transferase family protein [Chitinispirillaceae bacterium]
MKKKPKILLMADISGMGEEYHVGDEAMAEVASNRLKNLFGVQSLIMAAGDAKAITKTYRIKAFPYYNLKFKDRKKLLLKRPLSFVKGFLLMLYHLMRSDVVFICGGGNLTSVWPDVLEARLYLLRWAKNLKKKVFLVSQTLGPFSDQHKVECQKILSNAMWIGVRDKSFSGQQIGLPVQFAVDDAVFLEPEHSELTKKLIETNQPILALSLRDCKGLQQEQKQIIAGTISKLALEKGFHTVFIPHHIPQGDVQVAMDIKALWPSTTRFSIIEPVQRATALKAITKESQLVVTMRYHQLIFALSTGVPAVGIYFNEYTQAKLTGAFEQFEMEPCLISLNVIGPDLLNTITDVLQQKAKFALASNKVSENALDASMRPYREIYSIYNK